MKQKHWQVSVFDKTSETIKNDTFYTTDTEAYLVFELIDEDFKPDFASITVYNVNGKVTIHLNVDVVDGIVRYEIPQEAIEHLGVWKTQVIFTKNGEDYTTNIIEFEVSGHLLDKKKPKVVIITNWNHFIKHAGGIVEAWEHLEEIRQINEQQRELAESKRQSAESVRVKNEVERISKDSERNSKIENLEEQFQDVLDETTGKDVISAPELIAARNGKSNLKTRLDDEHAQVTAQLQQTEQNLSLQLAHIENDVEINYAKKNEVTNIITPKGNSLYADLPISGNTVGNYYYCSDGDGTHGAGNYVWNGAEWYFGGTGDEGYSLLKEALTTTTRNLWGFGDQSFTQFEHLQCSIPAGIYTLSAYVSTDAAKARIAFYDVNGVIIKYNDFENSTNRKSVSVSLTADVTDIYMYADITASASVGKTAEWKDIQLELGSTVTEYIPHFVAYDKIARESSYEAIQGVTSLSENIMNVVDAQYVDYWGFNDINTIDHYTIGTSGVTLLPAGSYVISAVFNSDAPAISMYAFGASTQTLINITPSPNKKELSFSLDSDIERLFFRAPRTGDYVGNTLVITDIRVVEANEWYCYKDSSSQEWTRIPYSNDYKGVLDNKLVVDSMKSYWNGKTINYNGDSITQGIAGTRLGYVQYVNKLLNFGKVNNYAIGGTRLAHVSDVADCMVDRITDMDTNADIVWIMANTNDYASQVPIGDANSTDITTYNGALNTIFTWLKTNYPTQPIIISTMLTRKVNYNESDNTPWPITIEQYAQAVRERCADYNFILFDAYKLSGLDLLNSPTDGSGITDDGLHPNEAGSIALGRKVAKFIDAQ